MSHPPRTTQPLAAQPQLVRAAEEGAAVLGLRAQKDDAGVNRQQRAVLRAEVALVVVDRLCRQDADAERHLRRVEEGLCACANLLPGMTSVYRWQGVIETAAECVALFKTTTVAAGALRDRLLTLHPYDEPAIIALPVEGEASSTGFLDWITAQVAARPVSPTDRKA